MMRKCEALGVPLAVMCAMLALVAPARSQSAPENREALSLVYDFEQVKRHESKDQWLIPAASGDAAWTATAPAEALETARLDGSRAIRPSGGFSIQHRALNQPFADGLRIEVTFRLDTLPDGKNVVLMRKWHGPSNDRTFMLFYRKPHVRLSISADGTGAQTATVTSERIDPDTTYHLAGWFDPQQGQLGLEHTAGPRKGKRRVTQTSIRRLHVSEEPVDFGAGYFDGTLDNVRLIAPLEDGQKRSP